MASQFKLEDCFVPVGRTTNICFDCENACGGCPWSHSAQPVPGWTAKKTVIRSSTTHNRRSEYYTIDTYHITACPMFVRTPDRKTDKAELTDAQFRRMNRIEQDGRANNGRKY